VKELTVTYQGLGEPFVLGTLADDGQDVLFRVPRRKHLRADCNCHPFGYRCVPLPTRTTKPITYNFIGVPRVSFTTHFPMAGATG